MGQGKDGPVFLLHSGSSSSSSSSSAANTGVVVQTFSGEPEGRAGVPDMDSLQVPPLRPPPQMKRRGAVKLSKERAGLVAEGGGWKKDSSPSSERSKSPQPLPPPRKPSPEPRLKQQQQQQQQQSGSSQPSGGVQAPQAKPRPSPVQPPPPPPPSLPKPAPQTTETPPQGKPPMPLPKPNAVQLQSGKAKLVKPHTRPPKPQGKVPPQPTPKATPRSQTAHGNKPVLPQKDSTQNDGTAPNAVSRSNRVLSVAEEKSLQRTSLPPPPPPSLSSRSSHQTSSTPPLPPRDSVDGESSDPSQQPPLPPKSTTFKSTLVTTLKSIIKPALPPKIITDSTIDKPKLQRKKKTVRFGPEAILQQVISDGDLEGLKALIQRQGVQIINKRDTNGEPLVVRAIAYKQLEVLQYMVSLEVDLTATNDQGWTALHAAVVLDDREYTKTLIKTGNPALTTIRSLGNLRPMDIAPSMEVAKMLLMADLSRLQSQMSGEHEQQASQPSSSSSTPSSTTLSDPLALLGCDDEETSLISCLMRKNEEDAKSFCRTKEKTLSYSLLHYAVTKNYIKLGFVVLKRRLVDIDVRDFTHQTPLHYAARKAHSDMILLLKQFGADITVTDVKGQTPAYLATPFHCTWLSTL